MTSRQAQIFAEEAGPPPPPKRRRLGGFLGLVCLIVALSACKKTDPALAGAAPPPSLDHSVKPGSARAENGDWQRASQGDPLELARLADREGAAGLLDGLEEGGVVGLTALLALPYADDAEIAYRRLGEILRQLEGEKAEPVLDAALGIASRPRTQTEPLDPEGTRYGIEALMSVAQSKAPEATRAKAVSALRLLADRDLVENVAIANLD